MSDCTHKEYLNDNAYLINSWKAGRICPYIEYVNCVNFPPSSTYCFRVKILENVVFPSTKILLKNKVLRMVEKYSLPRYTQEKTCFPKIFRLVENWVFHKLEIFGKQYFPEWRKGPFFSPSSLPHNSKCETNPLLRKGHAWGGCTNEK